MTKVYAGGGASSRKQLTKSATGGTIDLSKRKEGYNRDSGGKYYVPYDSHENPYRRPEYYIPPKEYGKIKREINTNYSNRYEGKTIGSIQNVVRKSGLRQEYNYDFEIHDFDEYNIFDKEQIK